MYEMTEEMKSGEGDIIPGKLVVRRGKEFTVTMTFDREINKDKDKVRLVLQTGNSLEINIKTIIFYIIKTIVF
jgi:hypothetical protein